MTGYYAQVQFGKIHGPCTSPPYPMSTQRPTTTAQQLPTISRRSSPEQEEQRTTSTTQHLAAVLRRPSPNEVEPLTIYPQQAHPALFKMLGKRPKKLEKPQANLPQKEDSVLPPASPHDQ